MIVRIGRRAALLSLFLCLGILSEARKSRYDGKTGYHLLENALLSAGYTSAVKQFKLTGETQWGVDFLTAIGRVLQHNSLGLGSPAQSQHRFSFFPVFYVQRRLQQESVRSEHIKNDNARSCRVALRGWFRVNPIANALGKPCLLSFAVHCCRVQ